MMMRGRDITMTVDDKERKGYHHAITQSMITIPMDHEPTGSNNSHFDCRWSINTTIIIWYISNTSVD
jgi:hypothetical protein